MTDTVSFLWRMRAYGHEVPAGLWEAAAAGARAAALTALVEAGTLAAGPVAPATGCIRLLEPLVGEAMRIGGSETSASDPGYLAGATDAPNARRRMA